MVNRKGFLAVTLCLTIWMVPVSADETADDIVTMMGWWQEYGRYWDEIGADTAGLGDDLSFAWLEDAIVEEMIVDDVAENTASNKADVTESVLMAKRSEP